QTRAPHPESNSVIAGTVAESVASCRVIDRFVHHFATNSALIGAHPAHFHAIVCTHVSTISRSKSFSVKGQHCRSKLDLNQLRSPADDRCLYGMASSYVAAQSLSVASSQLCRKEHAEKSRSRDFESPIPCGSAVLPRVDSLQTSCESTRGRWPELPVDPSGDDSSTSRTDESLDGAT